MRIIATGDKSRYQFLRSIVMSEGVEAASFRTEALGVHTLYVVSSDHSRGENVLLSEKLPLATEIVFPSELECGQYACGSDDRVILFDEFPFRTQEKMECLQSYAEQFGSGICEVVLFMNDRKLMESDISTEEMACEEAYGKYEAEGFSVYRYVSGSFTDFLFGSGNPRIDPNVSALKRNINATKEELQNIEIDYELGYELELHKFFENPAMLDSFFKYNGQIKGKAVNVYFRDNAERYFFGDRRNRYTDFYEKIYIRYITGICVWDLQKDLDILYERVKWGFENYFTDLPDLFCEVDERDYVKWINRNMQYILKCKEKIISFFEKELCQIVRGRIENKMERLEELLDEKNS